MVFGRDFGRAILAGLSSLRDRAANLRRRLAALRFNPSRLGFQHEYEPFCISSVIEDQDGNVLGRSTRRGRICNVCGATDAIGPITPCVPGKYFSR